MLSFFLTGLSHPVAFELEPGFNTVGRNPTNDLRIRDATVSSFHCEIVLDRDAVLVRDLGSSNGTFVDGQQVQEGALTPGSILRLGTFELRLELRDEEDATNVSVPELPVEAPPTSSLLPGGYPACLHHPSVYASFLCKRCQKKFCTECVRTLQLSGGKTHVFCPSCSALCDSLPLPEGVVTAPQKKPLSILGRLSQTIHIRPK